MTPYVRDLLCQRTHTTTQHDMEQAVLALYADHHYSVQATANTLNVCRQYVQQITNAHHAPRRTRGGANNPGGRGGKQPRLITYQGQTATCSAWARACGISPQHLHYQLYVQKRHPQEVLSRYL